MSSLSEKCALIKLMLQRYSLATSATFWPSMCAFRKIQGRTKWDADRRFSLTGTLSAQSSTLSWQTLGDSSGHLPLQNTAAQLILSRTQGLESGITRCNFFSLSQDTICFIVEINVMFAYCFLLFLFCFTEAKWQTISWQQIMIIIGLF